MSNFTALDGECDRKPDIHSRQTQSRNWDWRFASDSSLPLPPRLDYVLFSCGGDLLSRSLRDSAWNPPLAPCFPCVMIPQFCLRLIFGMSLSWCLMPRREVTSGFYRIQMLVTLGLSVLATLTLSHLNSEEGPSRSAPFYLLTIGLAICSFLGSVMWTLERRAAGLRYAVAVLVGSATSLALVTDYQQSIVPAWSEIVSQLSAGWLIGSAISTMLLGHWYLTATGMPLRPLQQYNSGLLGAIGLRILTAGLVFCWAPWPPETSQLIWLSLRWAGLVGPLVLTWLVFRVLQYRNTQSATGVLYAVDILIFLGEATAALLTRDLLAPF